MGTEPIVATAAPLAFIIALGYLAARAGVFRPGASAVFSTFALTFCLPALLLDATARTPPERLTEWRFFIGLCLGLASVFAAALAIERFLGRQPLNVSAMRAANVAAPDLAAIGLPIMLAVAGEGAIPGIVVGNLFLSLVLLPVALVCLNADRGDPTETPARMIRAAAREAMRSPLVWSPLAGVALAALQVQLPGVVHRSLALVGDALTSVLLFATGLFLAERSLRIAAAVPVNLIVKLIVQPAAMWAIALALGVTGESQRAMILFGALPTATVLPALAVQYGLCEKETEATIVLGVVLSVLSLGVIVALTGESS